MKSEGGVSPEAVVRARPDQVSSDLEGEVVILDLRSGNYFGLEEVGARVWELIQEPITVEGLLAAILDEYDVERERCRRDLSALLRALEGRGLVEVREP